MNEPLDKQLDEVLDFLKPYWEITRKISWRMIFRPFKVYGTLLKNGNNLFKSPDVMSGKSRPITKVVIERFSTKEEKETHAYKVFLGDYHIDEISTELIEKFPGTNFSKINKVYESKREVLKLNILHYLGIAAAGSSFIAHQVPKTIIEKVFNTQYETFEINLFKVMVGVTAFLCVFLIPSWFFNQREKKRHDYFASIIDYSAIKTSE